MAADSSAITSALEALDEPQLISFAPNMTEETFRLDVEPQSTESDLLFPPAECGTAEPEIQAKKPSHGRKKDKSHIPRPPNAFILFRSSFIKQQHIPGSIEGNHSQLSKIVGACWQRLSYEERQVWERKAKEARAEHKKMYPEYKFVRSRNASTKSSGSVKEKPPPKFVNTMPSAESANADGASNLTTTVVTPVQSVPKSKRRGPANKVVEDPKRCEQIAKLLVAGHKGSHLEALVQKLDNEAARQRKAGGLDVTEIKTPEQVAPRSSAPLPQPVRRSSSCPPLDIPAADCFRFQGPNTATPSVPKAPSRRPKPLRGASTMPYPPTSSKQSRSVSPCFSTYSQPAPDILQPTPVTPIEGPFANSTFAFQSTVFYPVTRPESVAPHDTRFCNMPSPSSTIRGPYSPWSPASEASTEGSFYAPFSNDSVSPSDLVPAHTIPFPTIALPTVDMHSLALNDGRIEGWNSDFDWMHTAEDETGSSTNPPSTPDVSSPAASYPSLPLEDIDQHSPPHTFDHHSKELLALDNYSKGMELFTQEPSIFPSSPSHDVYGMQINGLNTPYTADNMDTSMSPLEVLHTGPSSELWNMPYLQAAAQDTATYQF